MKFQSSQPLIFNEHFKDFVRKYVHSTLDKAEIPHFIHHITDSSVLVYVGLISDQDIAERCLMPFPFAKSSKLGIDEDSEAWIEIYF